MSEEELLKKIEGLEEIMKAQGMMFTSHMMSCTAFQEMIITKLELR
jgi:hypothetical protein